MFSKNCEIVKNQFVDIEGVFSFFLNKTVNSSLERFLFYNTETSFCFLFPFIKPGVVTVFAF